MTDKDTADQSFERSFEHSKPRLTAAEAANVVSLRTRLTELRYLSLEYLLRRASQADTRSAQTAWRSVWAIVVFCEHYNRFPRQGELYPYLHKVLDESKTLESLELPALTSQSAQEAWSAQRSTLEALQHEVSLYHRKISKIERALAFAVEANAAQSAKGISYLSTSSVVSLLQEFLTLVRS